MKTFFRDLSIRAYVWLQIFAMQEPVRLRAALTSAVLALGVLVPALASQETAHTVGGVLAVVLPIVVGESARRRVTPADEE
ncbi:hypothetical protein [Streptomyces sp. NPDC056061]|uniref:hypothetical protein n=1 Tax=Streptomyces sp. NPDC056061 TaxID=3345700 RepID=UPI0035D98DB7